MTTCNIDNCKKPIKARNLCAMHHQRLMRHGDPLMVKPTRTKSIVICNWIGCTKLVTTKGHCAKHYYIKRVLENKPLTLL